MNSNSTSLPDAGCPLTSLLTKQAAVAALALACVTASANDAPVVSIHIGGNSSFVRQNEPMRYLAVVSDSEEGDTLAGTVDPSSVAVEFQYLQAGVDGYVPQPAEAGVVLGATRGRELIENDDCLLCHVERATGRTAVPTFAAIAEKFQGNLAVAPALAVNIQNGTQGIWGTMLMPAHATTTPRAMAMSYYILSFAGDGNTREFLRTTGEVSVDLDPYLVRGPFGAFMPGRYVLSATYTDRGAPDEAAANGYATHALRYPNVAAAEIAVEQGFALETRDGFEVLVPGAADAVARLERIDLTGVTTITLATAGSGRRWSGGTAELRIGAPDGRRVGTFVVAHDERRLAVGHSVVRVGGLQGVHDLYVVVPEAESVAIGAVCFDCSP